MALDASIYQQQSQNPMQTLMQLQQQKLMQQQLYGQQLQNQALGWQQQGQMAGGQALQGALSASQNPADLVKNLSGMLAKNPAAAYALAPYLQNAGALQQQMLASRAEAAKQAGGIWGAAANAPQDAPRILAFGVKNGLISQEDAAGALQAYAGGGKDIFRQMAVSAAGVGGADLAALTAPNNQVVDTGADIALIPTNPLSGAQTKSLPNQNLIDIQTSSGQTVQIPRHQITRVLGLQDTGQAAPDISLNNAETARQLGITEEQAAAANSAQPPKGGLKPPSLGQIGVSPSTQAQQSMAAAGKSFADDSAAIQQVSQFVPTMLEVARGINNGTIKTGPVTGKANKAVAQIESALSGGKGGDNATGYALLDKVGAGIANLQNTDASRAFGAMTAPSADKPAEANMELLSTNLSPIFKKMIATNIHGGDQSQDYNAVLNSVNKNWSNDAVRFWTGTTEQRRNMLKGMSEKDKDRLHWSIQQLENAGVQ